MTVTKTNLPTASFHVGEFGIHVKDLGNGKFHMHIHGSSKCANVVLLEVEGTSDDKTPVLVVQPYNVNENLQKQPACDPITVKPVCPRW